VPGSLQTELYEAPSVPRELGERGATSLRGGGDIRFSELEGLQDVLVKELQNMMVVYLGTTGKLNALIGHSQMFVK
jgi:hypothetical protein